MGDAVLMRIVDDGIGFDPAQTVTVNGQRHLGIVSMYERAAIVGGELDVFSAPGQGTAIHVSCAHLNECDRCHLNPYASSWLMITKCCVMGCVPCWKAKRICVVIAEAGTGGEAIDPGRRAPA